MATRGFQTLLYVKLNYNLIQHKYSLKRTCSPAELDCVQAVRVNETECPHYCEGIVMGVERPYSVIDEKELVNFFADYENFKYPDGSNLTFPQAMAGEYDRFDSIEFSKIKLLLKLLIVELQFTSKLKFVQISVSISTFDRIKKVKTFY